MKFKSLLILFIFTLNQYSCMGNAENYESDSLNYKVRVPVEQNTKMPMLILLHGYGSNENDLFSLFNQVPSNWLVISVRAPMIYHLDNFREYETSKF
jgi:predicted esterase